MKNKEKNDEPTSVSRNGAKSIVVRSCEELNKDLSFYKKHLIHLDKNSYRLNYSFVQEETEAINNVIKKIEDEIYSRN